MPSVFGRETRLSERPCREGLALGFSLSSGLAKLESATNLTGVDPATVGKRYIRLTEAEWAFRIASGDIVLPAESAGGIRTTVRSRHVTEPEAEQEALLRRLGLTLPRRLKRLDGHAPVE
ncbi:hypothetical protein EBR56_06040 [bacterium]|nr:hypothetical protein [bacterium]